MAIGKAVDLDERTRPIGCWRQLRREKATCCSCILLGADARGGLHFGECADAASA